MAGLELQTPGAPRMRPALCHQGTPRAQPVLGPDYGARPCPRPAAQIQSGRRGARFCPLPALARLRVEAPSGDHFALQQTSPPRRGPDGSLWLHDFVGHPLALPRMDGALSLLCHRNKAALEPCPSLMLFSLMTAQKSASQLLPVPSPFRCHSCPSCQTKPGSGQAARGRRPGLQPSQLPRGSWSVRPVRSLRSLPLTCR